MELGMLYEFDCPHPWAGEHPWGQRTIERQAYRDKCGPPILAAQAVLNPHTRLPRAL
jgi:hypothetical protein